MEPVEENVRGHQNFIPRALPRLDDHFHAYGNTATEPTLSPSIDTTNTPTNVTVIKGKSATLACVVRNIGNEVVRVLFIYYHFTGLVSLTSKVALNFFLENTQTFYTLFDPSVMVTKSKSSTQLWLVWFKTLEMKQ